MLQYINTILVLLYTVDFALGITQSCTCINNPVQDESLVYKVNIKGTMSRYGSRAISMISLAVKS